MWKIDEKISKSLLITSLVLLFCVSLTQAQVVQPAVTVVPDTANYYADYDIDTATGPGAALAPGDIVYVLFDTTTILPVSISPSLITINSVPVSSVIISGQQLSLYVPEAIPNRDPIFISIDAAAKIRNPNDEDGHYLWVSTSIPQDADTVRSGGYSFFISTQKVSPASVTPSPSIANEAAAYTIGFNIGGGGYLNANNSNISITFGSGTTVPDGVLSGVTVNGTAATAIANLGTVVITMPVDVDNNGSVQVVFAEGSGLLNSETAGDYTLQVRTSSQPTWTESETYTISAVENLSVSAISTKPDTVNQSGAFSLEARTGTLDGSLVQNVDEFSVIFPPNTYIPSSISTNNVTISSGGFSDNPPSITITHDAPSAGEVTVDIVTPIAIGDGADVSINFAAAAGYANPSVAGNYQLQLATSKEGPVTSNPYSVFATSTTISQPLVTPTDNSANTATSYTVSFNLGRLGRLQAGTSTITLTFPAGYTISETPADYDLTTISVAGGTPISPASIVANSASRTIQITLPEAAITANGDNIVLFIADSGPQPITNPGTGNYQVGVKTSVETAKVNSLTYSIGGSAITINEVRLTNNTVNNSSEYAFNINTTNALKSGDNITIVFPQGTVLPSGILINNMYIDGQTPTSISVNQSTRTVTAYVRQSNLPNGPGPAKAFDVRILSAANIINPAVPSTTFYKVTMNTNLDTQLQTSDPYDILGGATQPTVDNVIVNPSVIDATNVSYTVNFTTSATGKLVGGAAAGSSTIDIEFDAGTILPTDIIPSNVAVNTTPAQNVSVDVPSSVVTITVPNGMTIGNSSSVSVEFKSGAGLVNSALPGIYNISVKTSSDMFYSTGTAGDYEILATAPLSFTSVTPSPSTQNANAGYSIKFKTGSSGALSPGNSIQLVFPENTALPTSLSTSDITIEGVNPGSATVLDQTVTLTLATDPLPGQSIGATTDVTILISQAAGILNPTQVGGYTINLITASEPGPYISPVYNITQGSSTVSNINVSPNPVSPGSDAVYTIDFNVGSGGRLLAETSTITITFNASTTISSAPGDYNNSDIIVDGFTTDISGNISVSGQELTFTVPSGVSIDNNDAVSVVLDGLTPIQNPSVTGDYTLEVRTSVETTDIMSNSFTITSASAVTGITALPSPLTVNAEAAYTVDFQIQNELTAPGATITATFPSYTFVPVSMSTATVRVAHDLTDPTPTAYDPAAGVITNASTRTVTITVPETIPANHFVSVNFLSTAGLENPPIAGDKTLQVKTSAQNINGSSDTYTLDGETGTTILNFSIDVTPRTPLEFGQYTYSFTTGSLGRLVSGLSTITLLIPDDATFTEGEPTLSKVTVNGTAAQALDLITGSPDRLIVTVPSSVTIGNSTNVTVIIDETAGLQNASTTDSKNYSAFTSVETLGQGTDYSLPVELTSFIAETESGVNYLEWVTESELENAYWMIERKKLSKEEYGSIQKGDANVNLIGTPFAVLDHIEGQGSISLETKYTYTDSLVEVGLVYAYRLADVSYNGEVTYHDVIYVELEAPSEFVLFENYPNPFNPSTTIKYNLPIDSRVDLKIYNVLGQEIITLVDDVEKSGFHHLQWNGTTRSGQSVASGMYILAIRAKESGGKEHTKMMKILFIK